MSNQIILSIGDDGTIQNSINLQQSKDVVVENGKEFSCKKLVIPEGVKSIAPNAFFNNKNLEEVYLPESLDFIGPCAFMGCSNLRKVYFGDKLTTISHAAFNECSKLDDVVLPENLKNLNSDAFANCSSLKRIILPPNIYHLGSGCFANCESLEQINIPENAKIDKASSSVFIGCRKLKDVHLPSTMTCIPAQFFQSCENLEDVHITQKITAIHEGAFNGCRKLKDFSFPNSLREIGKFAFSGCKSLTKADLSSYTGTIDSKTFANCTNLTSVTLSDVTSDICDGAFSGCKSLKKISLPKHLKNIGRFAFQNSGIEEINLPAGTEDIDEQALDAPHLKSINILPEDRSTSRKLDTVEEKNAYWDETWQHLADKIDQGRRVLKFESPDGVSLQEIFGPYFVQLAPACGLKEYRIPDGQVILGDHAFSQNNDLEKLTIPSSVSYFYPNTFTGAKNLKTLIIEKQDLYSAVAFSVYQNDIFASHENYGNFENFIFKGNFSQIDLSFCNDFPKIKSIELPEDGHIIIFSHVPVNLPEVVIPKSICEVREGTFAPETTIKFECGTTVSGKDFHCMIKHTSNNIQMMAVVMKNDPSFLIVGDKTYTYNLKEYLNNFSNYSEIANYLFHLEELRQHNLKGSILRKPYFSKVLFKDSDMEFIGKSVYKNFDSNVKRVFELLDDKNSKYLEDLLKVMFNFGALDEDPHKRQIVCNFIVEKLLPEIDSKFAGNNILEKLHSAFNSMQLRKDANPRLQEFFMREYKGLIEMDDSRGNLLPRTINAFDEIQNMRRRRSGNADLLLVTIDECKRYFMLSTFKGVTKKNEPIAMFLTPYFSSDLALEHAVILCKDSKKAPRNIFTKRWETVNKKTGLPQIVFDNSPKNDLRETEHKFNFEWVPKQDKRNLVPGCELGCCASITCAGEAMPVAAMVDDDCQNLFIHNDNGKLVAKAFLYLNREKGYGVYNAFIVHSSIKDNEDKLEVYNALVRGSKTFMQAYNKNNPDCPLKQINCGLGHSWIFGALNKSTPVNNPLPIMDFKAYVAEKYGEGWKGYNGDASTQTIIVPPTQSRDKNQKTTEK